MKLLSNLLLLFFIFSSSAYAGGKPDWINGSSKKYPEPHYFIGVGSTNSEKGSAKQTMSWAAERARAELAKILKTEVNVVSKQERDVKSGDKSHKPQSSSKLNDVIVESSNQVLEGVEVKEYYTDKKTKTIYALAVLDRVKTGDLIEGRIKRLLNDVSSEMDEGRGYQTSGKYIPAMRHYSKALTYATNLNEQKELLSVVEPTGGRVKAGDYVSEIRNIMTELKKHVRFSVTVTGPAEMVKSYLIKGISKAGYSVGSTSENASYRLVGLTDVTRRGDMNMGPELNLQIYNATLDLEVQDAQSGDILGSMNFSANANEKTDEMASKYAVRALGRNVEEQLGKRLMDIF